MGPASPNGEAGPECFWNESNKKGRHIKAAFFNEAEGAPGFALEPVAHFRSLPIGALPLWPAFGGHPDDLGELLPQTPSGSRPLYLKTKKAAIKATFFNEAEGARTLNLRIDSPML